MIDRNALYELLFKALLELRYEGYEIQNTKVIKLADLFHNLPAWLKDIDAGTATADDVLLRFRARAHELQIERWIDQCLSDNAKVRQAIAG